MSILNNPIQPEVPVADRVANQIVNQARMTFQQLVMTYTQGSKSFWSNPRATPQQIAASLGTNAAEVFSLHAKIGALLDEVKPGSTDEGKAVVGQFTVNADGSVTVPAPAGN